MLLSDAVREGFRAVRRSKRLIALVAFIDGLVALPAAIYLFREIHAAGAHREDATELAQAFHPSFLADVRRESGFDANLTALIGVALLLFFLVQPLVRGGYVGIAANRRQRLPFADFVRDGGAVYWKYVRVALLGLVVCYLLSLAARPLLEYMEDLAERLESEAMELRYQRITELVVFGAFLAVATVLDYARVGIRLYRRPGVLKEFLRSTLFVLQHPLKTLGLALAALALEIGVVAVFVPLLRWADGAYVLTSIVVLVLVQVLVMLREAVRLFHLAGAWTIRVAEEGAGTEGSVRAEAREPDLLENLPWHTG